MQTIQEVLRKLDRKELEGAYFYDYGIKLWELNPEDTRTIKEIKEKVSENFQKFVDRLCNMEVKQPEDGKIRILYAHREIYDTVWSADIAADLVYADEIMKAEDLAKVEHYAYEFTPQEEALGYLVADTKLTQDHLYDVAVSFLNEMSFFGYDQEDMNGKKEELLESVKEAEEHPEKLVPFSTDDLRKKLGFPKDEKYPKEEEIKDKIIKHIAEYNRYCKKTELKKIRKMLLPEKQKDRPKKLKHAVKLNEKQKSAISGKQTART